MWARHAIECVDIRCSGTPLDRRYRITLNFHPDREAAGRNILDALHADGVYRSQFETGTSNGGLTAHPGGDRWLWEQKLFCGVYDGGPAAERPKYGALNHRNCSLGGAPRFGSAHLRLAEHMLDRATFCFPDSAHDPARFATAEHFDLLPLGTGATESPTSAPTGIPSDPLDGYVEAQVHGRVALEEDVEALVLDPCYRGSVIQTKAETMGISLEWHEGRYLSVETLDSHSDYRDPPAVEAGHRIARDGCITALVIGEAYRSGRYDPRALKQLWHIAAQWGTPLEAGL